MKISELIIKLHEFNQDLEVEIADADTGYALEIERVTQGSDPALFEDGKPNVVYLAGSYT